MPAQLLMDVRKYFQHLPVIVQKGPLSVSSVDKRVVFSEDSPHYMVYNSCTPVACDLCRRVSGSRYTCVESHGFALCGECVQEMYSVSLKQSRPWIKLDKVSDALLTLRCGKARSLLVIGFGSCGNYKAVCNKARETFQVRCCDFGTRAQFHELLRVFKKRVQDSLAPQSALSAHRTSPLVFVCGDGPKFLGGNDDFQAWLRSDLRL